MDIEGVSKVATHWVWGLALVLTAACSGGGSDNGGASGTTSGGTSGKPTQPVEGSCTANALFSPEPHGDTGDDMFRAIKVDEATKDVYLQDLAQVFKVSPGSGGPVALGEHPRGADVDRLWLDENQLLFPGAYKVDSLPQQLPVLIATNFAAGDVKYLVTDAAPSSDVNYMVRSVHVVGDDVYWLAWEEPRPASTSQPWPEGTYRLRRSSWRSPDEPEELYVSHRRLDELVVAGDLAFVTEETMPGSYVYDQTIFDLTAKAPLAETAEAKFGGRVVAGDEQSVFVSILRTEEPIEIGLFRMDHDGGGKQLVSTNVFAGHFTKANDVWAFTDAQAPGDPTLVQSYRVGSEPKLLGCIHPDATTHALDVTSSQVYVGIFQDQTTTVMAFDL